jgi:hypothetical protein
MKRLRPMIAAASVCLVLLSGFAPAHAGGSTIEFPRWVLVGDTVTGHGVFGAGQQEAVSAGPWLATLESGRGVVDPIPLGEVEIVPAETGWRATVTFVVPDVPTGSYSIWVANGQGDGVGDLVGGWTVIAHTPVEGRLLTRFRGLAVRDRSHTHAIEALRDARASLRRELGVSDGVAAAQGARLADLRASATDLQARLAAPSERPIWPFGLAVLGAALLVVVAFLLGRRSGRYATRTLVTCARRSWTENQDEPESGEPKTSPLVAPK